jgi:hypothetical protein
VSELDRSRAATAQTFSNAYLATADEPMLIDLIPAIFGKPMAHCMIWGVSFTINIPSTGRPPDARGLPPNSGLWLCPPGTLPETLGMAQVGLTLAARPYALPLNDPYLNVANVNLGWSVQMTAQLGTQHVLPMGWFIRAILNCQQASATPGPGVGSQGILTAMVSQETDQDLSSCR